MAAVQLRIPIRIDRTPHRTAAIVYHIGMTTECLGQVKLLQCKMSLSEDVHG